jgi:hypothetical protein
MKDVKVLAFDTGGAVLIALTRYAASPTFLAGQSF